MPGYSYKLQNFGIDALDAQSAKDPIVDKGRMAATGVLATEARDREGDIFDLAGLDTKNHQLNPVVLADHGQWHPLPIGKNVDEGGNYTVTVDLAMGEVLQTTYFSQHCPLAEQIYHLICEGVLKANSIGYRTLASKPLAPRGKHILKSELLESSWVALPCNQEAVMAYLSKDRIEGKSLHHAIKAMLTPHVAKQTSITRSTGGAVQMKKVAPVAKKDMSAVDETEGGALREEETVETESDAPFGADMLRDLHGDLADVKAQYEGAAKKLDNEKVKTSIPKLLEDIESVREDVAEIFAAAYPDLDPLAEAAEEEDDEEEEVVEEESELEEEEEAKTAKTLKVLGKKRLTKTQTSTIDDAKSVIGELLESEGLGKTTKMALKFIAKAFDEMCAAKAEEAATDEEEEVSEDEQKRLKTLERAIARRMDLLAKM